MVTATINQNHKGQLHGSAPGEVGGGSPNSGGFIASKLWMSRLLFMEILLIVDEKVHSGPKRWANRLLPGVLLSMVLSMPQRCRNESALLKTCQLKKSHPRASIRVLDRNKSGGRVTALTDVCYGQTCIRGFLQIEMFRFNKLLKNEILMPSDLPIGARCHGNSKVAHARTHIQDSSFCLFSFSE